MILGNRISEVYKNALHYDDVFIIPKYSDIYTRKLVDISYKTDKFCIPVPILAANMDTVINAKTAIALNFAGASSALHRFQTIDSAVQEYKEVVRQITKTGFSNDPVFVSIGVNRDAKERMQELYKAGAREFVIDIAHGHSKQMKNILTWIYSEYPNAANDLFIVGGNVATGEAVTDLITWGCHAAKVGLAGGSVCRTKNVTGVTIPMISSLTSAVTAARKAEQKFGRKFTIIADGGCREIGDVCKALATGADLVMSGRFFASCDESPKGTAYRGSASADAQVVYRTDKTFMPTPEGTTEELDGTGPVSNTVELIAGGIRSSFSYVNARNMEEYHKNCEFGVRYNKT